MSTANRLEEINESIFATISKMANQYGAVNLGQGFPNFDGPDFLKKYACEAIMDGHNQYSSFKGHPDLRKSIKSIYERIYQLSFDHEKEITVTFGATEAIFITILALVNPGDEVVVFEPFYDSYVASIKMAGGIPVPVTLHAPEFRYDQQELEKAVTAKTKLIIFNNPHNPTGRVFDNQEMSGICDVASRHKCYILSDEVYEHLTFDQVKFTPLYKFTDNFELRKKIITISSIGKTFGVTGWKLGWIIASKEISKAVGTIHQYNTFCCTTPLQIAVAKALDELEDYLPSFKASYLAKRDLLLIGLKQAGFEPITPMGTYFALAPINQLTQKSDIDYCLELIKTKKVATIPPSSFYLKSKEGENYLRFCFAKTEETLNEAIMRLRA